MRTITQHIVSIICTSLKNKWAVPYSKSSNLVKAILCLAVFGFASSFFSRVHGQCDVEVSGVIAYCNSFSGNNPIPGYFIGFRIQSNNGTTLNVVDLAGNVPMNLGKRINNINEEFEPSDTSRMMVQIGGGSDSLEFWYFGPFTDGDSFNIVLIDPTGVCDTIEVASGTFTCEGQDPNACDENVPLYFLDFSESQWTIGGGGGGNENVDQVFVIMQRSRVATCCHTGNQRCFEFIITLDEDDIGILIDDVGNGSTGGKIFADSLNGFMCGTSQNETWPFIQENGQSADDPLCLSGSAREWIVLSCKQGNNVTGISVGTVGEINVLPEYTYENCEVVLDVLNANSAFWSSPDDPNLDNLISYGPDSLSATFLYDAEIFGPVTSCDGDTFTYYVGGYPDNTCLQTDSLYYDTTFVVVYPDFSVAIDSVCIGSDSVLLEAILTTNALNCGYRFVWSTGDTTQSILVPDTNAVYTIRVFREDIDSLVRDCDPALDTINVEPRFILCLPDMFFECVAEPPPSSAEQLGIGGCVVTPLIYSYDISNNGSGCILDSLIILRYYIVDFDGDTVNTLSDKDTCIQLLVYVDDIAPVIQCPPNMTISCTASTLPDDTGGFASASDNCDPSPMVTYSEIINGGSCLQEYVIVRTWLATDSCGNSNSCNQIISIEDILPPVIICPADITIQCTEDTTPSNTGAGTATDNCDPLPVLSFTDDVTQGTCPVILTRTWRATDACGNSSTCIQFISLLDSSAPAISCPPDLTISCSESTDPSNTGMATGTDNCDPTLMINYSDNVVSGNCPQNLFITRTWSVTDDCGNFTSCIQLITTMDTLPPVITCPPDVIIQCNDSTLPAQTGTSSAIDNCDPVVSITFSDTIAGGSCPAELTITRTWTATDDCGNSNTCVQTIIVRDTIPPDLSCPANITIQCTENTLPPNTGTGTATDNCDAFVVPTYSDSIENGSCPQQYTINRRWLVEDDCGNTSECVQIIEVQDTTRPVIICPPDTIIDCSENILPSNTGYATGTDNCDTLVAITFNDNINIGGCPQEYTIERTWSATDDCGNVNSCIQLIMVQDTVVPDIVCPADITITFPASTLPENTGMATATDNCDTSVTLTYTDVLPASCPELHIILRTWTATDDCGNTSTCQQSILVDDHGSICGYVEDEFDQPLDSVEIQLYADVNNSETYDAGDTLIASVMTDTSGNYCFQDIKPCNYILVEIQPLTYGDLLDYDFTPDPDGNDSLDGPDNEIPVTLGQGEADHENNFIDIICPLQLPVIPPDTICAGDSVVFETEPLNPGTLTYTWDFGSGSTPASAMGLGPHTVSYVTTTDNQMSGALIMLTVSRAGCPDLTGQVSTVDVNAYPNAAISGSIANLCYFTNRTFQPVAQEIPGATYNWNFGNNAVPLTATGYGPHTVYYTVSGPKTVSLVIYPNEAGAQCPDSSSISFNVTNCPGNITGTVKSVTGTGIQGVNIRLFADANEDGVADNNIPIRSVFSTANGSYSMVGLTPASYVIVQTQPPLWSTVDDEDTSDDGDPVPNIDSLDNLIPATVNPNEIDAHNIFTEIAIPGSISGAVFVDTDGDQSPDAGEGIPGVVISCYNDNDLDGQPDTGTPVDTAVTSSTGHYTFTTIPIGNYVLVETQPEGYESVIDFDATNDQDSVPNTNTMDDIIPVTLMNQENDQHNYFINNFECTLMAVNLNDSGPGSLRFMVGCAAVGDTIIIDTSLAGDTIQITSSKIIIEKDVVIYSTCVPRVTIASSIPGLFDIALNKVVSFIGLDLISGVTGSPAAAFYNFGILTLQDIHIFRNPLLPPADYLIRNTPESQIFINGNCNLYEN